MSPAADEFGDMRGRRHGGEIHRGTIAAMRRLALAVEAFWHRHPHHLQPLLAHEEERDAVMQALRLCEAMLESPRLFVIVRAPFEEPGLYFSTLVDQVAATVERERRAPGRKRGELHAFASREGGTGPSRALERIELTLDQAASLLEPRFSGIVVVLAPDQVTDLTGWRESVGNLVRTRWSRRVHVAVFGVLGSPLCDVVPDGGARFDLAPDIARVAFDLGPDALLVFLDELAPGAGTRALSAATTRVQLRPLLSQARRRMDAQDAVPAAAFYQEARDVCVAESLTMDEAACLLGLGRAWILAKMPAPAYEAFTAAGVRAEQEADRLTACHAWLAAAGAAVAQARYDQAAVTYRAAAGAATNVKLAAMTVEALRLTGVCWLRAGREDLAVAAWKEAVTISKEMKSADRHTTAFETLVAALMDLLERRGAHQEPDDVWALLERRPVRYPDEGSAGDPR